MCWLSGLAPDPSLPLPFLSALGKAEASKPLIQYSTLETPTYLHCHQLHCLKWSLMMSCDNTAYLLRLCSLIIALVKLHDDVEICGMKRAKRTMDTKAPWQTVPPVINDS